MNRFLRQGNVLELGVLGRQVTCPKSSRLTPACETGTEAAIGDASNAQIEVRENKWHTYNCAMPLENQAGNVDSACLLHCAVSKCWICVGIDA